jgi:flagellar motor component MotA
MSEKWNKQNRKGYLKIHVAVDIKTKEVLALEVTDEKAHDSKMLKKLVNNVLDNQDKKKIKSVLADGAPMIQIPTSNISKIKRSLPQ